ncbi:dipicolinate synthase subunit DpsA [Risungbinella massiliensis]|uniref:dipicolinate synthase subunit DpsA n=1 Tax=Risungbinella massiliensis TaxID=1329796 RepID=UPI0005CBAFB5|nr:dipicolinate synthase subunit DpsA [Risungbinella massiliensis]
MLTGKHVVFLGGDARQLEVIKSCLEWNARVSCIGFDNLQTPPSEAAIREFRTSVLETADILVLPIVGTDDEGKINSVFTSKKLVLQEEHLKAVPSHCLVFTGMARPYLRDLCKQFDLTLVELLSRDDIAIYNSIPTVEGALMMAIQHTDITIHGSQSIVLGLGRVGLSLARALDAIGANVHVGVLTHAQYARAFEMGLNPFYSKDLVKYAKEADLIFNTVPARIVTDQILRHVPHDVVIIDLASKPGGVDFDYAKKRGIKAILTPSLPGVVAPKTAGQILAKTMAEVMLDEWAKGGVSS